MTAKILLDTNLWVYLYAKNPPEKYQAVYQIVADQFETIVVSTQILGELFNVLTRKNLISPSEAKTIILEMATTFPILSIDTANVLLALDLNSHFQYSYWDSLVVATALLADCQVLYSEDMQHQQVIDGKMQLLNPFAAI
ncbi:MAG: twitching motility protein PilT [Chloroflexota bacterium]|nr:MAG: twitching motility protein PilT [Chloroflexota bacterium]